MFCYIKGLSIQIYLIGGPFFTGKEWISFVQKHKIESYIKFLLLFGQKMKSMWHEIGVSEKEKETELIAISVIYVKSQFYTTVSGGFDAFVK